MEDSLFSNQIKDPIFDEFNRLYGERLIAICPFINKFKIKVIPIEVLIESSKVSEEEAKNQAFLNHIEKQEEDASSTQAYIVKDNTTVEALELTQEEQFAAIAHELGHILFFFQTKKDGKGGQGEEICADKYACRLGLKEPLKRVIRKLLDTDWYLDEIKQQLKSRLFWIEYYC